MREIEQNHIGGVPPVDGGDGHAVGALGEVAGGGEIPPRESAQRKSDGAANINAALRRAAGRGPLPADDDDGEMS